ncbi:MAG: hypothetical protein ABSE62_05220 [Chthoniobacteraceae bacterium]|jgi:hypothetical protein
MKLSKLLLSGLCAAGLAATASATTTTIHIIGSTAFRAPVTQGIVDYLTTNYGTPSYGFWGNSTFLKANGALLASSSGGNTVVVETFWTGSAAGVVDLVLGHTISDFLNYSTYSGVITTSGTYFGSNAGSLTFATAVAADAAMTDSYYSSVAKVMSDATITGTTGAGVAAAITNAGSHGTLINAGVTAGPKGTVGIIPFLWVMGNPGATGLSASNIDFQVAKQLLENGSINFSQLSGTSTDLTNYALLVGRNEDSGTRIDSAANVQDGFDIVPVQALVEFSSTSNQQSTSVFPLPPYGVQTGGFSSTGGTFAQISSIEAWPSGLIENGTATSAAYLNTESTINWDSVGAGHSGYVSGGDVANVLSAYNPGAANIVVDDGASNLPTDDPSGNYPIAPSDADYTAGTSQIALIGYLGVADAYSDLASNGGVTIAGQSSNAKLLGLSYNGVTYSANAVEQGQYTLWGYEHMYYTTAAGTVKTVLDGIADKVFTTDADLDSGGNHAHPDQAGIKYSTMNFNRSSVEGGILGPVN